MDVTGAGDARESSDGTAAIAVTTIGEGSAVDTPRVQRPIPRESSVKDPEGYRLTFFFDSHRFHLRIEKAGNIEERSGSVAERQAP